MLVPFTRIKSSSAIPDPAASTFPDEMPVVSDAAELAAEVAELAAAVADDADAVAEELAFDA